MVEKLDSMLVTNVMYLNNAPILPVCYNLFSQYLAHEMDLSLYRSLTTVKKCLVTPFGHPVAPYGHSVTPYGHSVTPYGHSVTHH